MNHKISRSISSKLSGAVWAAVVSGLLLVGTVHAQNLYFDPNNTDSAAGGSGSFSTGSFYNGSGDQAFTSGATANFNGAAGDVSVETPVSAGDLEIGVTSGTENIGTSGANSQVTLGPVGFNYSLSVLNINNGGSGTENVNFNSNLNLNVENQYYNDLTLQDNTSGNVAINGGITFTNNTNTTTDPTGNSMGEPNLQIYAGNGGSVTINSAISQVDVPGAEPIQNGNTPYLVFNASSASSTMTLTSNASFVGTNVGADSGTILDQGATFSAGAYGAGDVHIDGTGQYLTDADGLDVSTTIQNNGGGMTVGGALADDTSFSGVIISYASNTDINLTAAAGGTVTFSNSVEFNGGSNDVINKIGAGTVRITYTQNSAPNFRTFSGNSEIKNGTLLLDANNALSAAGTTLTIDEVAPAAVNATQTKATLGGIGSFAGNVVANGPDSVVAPGDPGAIGTLQLQSLAANNGLTMDFKLNGGDTSGYGVTNDYLYVGTLSLGGPVTVNIENLGSITTGTPYVLMSGGGGNWTGDPTFTFNVPAGYALDDTYGTPDGLPDGKDLGYDYDTTGNTFSVQFVAVPEPSTYGLLGLGLAGLLVIGRIRRLGRE